MLSEKKGTGWPNFNEELQILWIKRVTTTHDGHQREMDSNPYVLLMLKLHFPHSLSPKNTA